ncbi:MAG TPA: polysaccharide biosynthesis/export family protein [Pyrinomonadaceae bacterium]|nr:polysaccharide biosynthesis/export family protein [Pyrinomonadaceae bacterium]
MYSFDLQPQLVSDSSMPFVPHALAALPSDVRWRLCPAVSNFVRAEPLPHIERPNHVTRVTANAKQWTHLALVAIVLGCAVSAAGQQAVDTVSSNKTVSPTTVTSTPAAASADDRYRIGPGDVLDIRILNRPNLSREAVRVEGNGMIRMPLIDTEIMAACKTEGELAKEIANGYLKFYRKPQVDVFIKEYRSVTIAVIGAVNDQNRFQLQRRIRLLELLTYARGPSEKAGQTINVVHAPPVIECNKGNSEPDELAFSSYRLSDTLAGKPDANPYLQAGDIVTLPEAEQAYVVGNVLSPRAIPLDEPITLTHAIAMAGGVAKDSKKDKIRIVRQEPGSKTKKEIMVDLNAIEKKRAEDIALLPNDVVHVQVSEARSLLRSIIGGGAQSITQLPVRVIP